MTILRNMSVLLEDANGGNILQKAIVVTNNKFPDQDAGALREYSFSKILSDLGYSVDVISMGESTNFSYVKVDENIRHISLRGKGQHKLQKVLDYFLFPFRLWRVLKDCLFDICLYTEIERPAHIVLKQLCKQKQSIMIFDSVEWYSASEFPNGEHNHFYKQNTKYNTKYVDGFEKVISISSYLHKHFQNRQIKTIRIPVILDVEKLKITKENLSDERIILYAGSPGTKDKISLIIQGVALLSESDRENVKFYILGCTEDEIASLNPEISGLLNELKSTIHIMGRVPRNKVIEYYKIADYSIFLRDPTERFAKAGFPTKFAESMAMSTPVICNISSDLTEYLQDGINGLVIQSLKPEYIALSLHAAISMDKGTIGLLMENARKTSKQFFDYKVYKGLVKQFIENK